MAFIVSLQQPHEAKGDTIYRVAKDTGVSRATVTLYVSGDVELETIYPSFVKLAKYYGVDWKKFVTWRDEATR